MGVLNQGNQGQIIGSPTPDLSPYPQFSRVNPPTPIFSPITSSSSSVLGKVGSSLLNIATGGLSSAVSGVISSIFGGNSMKKQYKYQRELQQMQNDYNSMEAQKNRDFQERMSNEQNEYNSAVNQRKRLEEAGLNPNIMMSGSDAGTASGASASGAQGQTGLGQVGLPNVSTDPLMLAQIRNINADTEFKREQSSKTSAERDLDLIERKFRALVLKSQTDVNDADAFMKKSVAMFQDSARRVQEYNLSDLLPQQISESVAKIALMDIQGHLAHVQANRIVEVLPYEIASILKGIQVQDSTIELNSATIRKITEETTGELIKNGVLAKDFDNYDTDKVYRRIGLILGASGSLVGLAGKMLTGH